VDVYLFLLYLEFGVVLTGWGGRRRRPCRRGQSCIVTAYPLVECGGRSGVVSL
jgi:hypothetical protein